MPKDACFSELNVFGSRKNVLQRSILAQLALMVCIHNPVTQKVNQDCQFQACLGYKASLNSVCAT